MILSCAISWQLRQRLPAAELAARRCTTRSSTTRTLILVTEDEAAFFQVIWRHLDRHPIARQRLDPVLFHLAGGVGDDLVSGIELHAITCIGEDFGDQSFELDQLFFSHGYLQIDRRSALRPLGAVGSGIRTAFAMQKSDPLHRFSLAAALRRTYRLLPVDLVPVGLRNATITARTVVTARPFRSGRGFMAPGGVHTRSGPRVNAARSHEAAPGSKGPRRHHRPGGNSGVPQTNRHEVNRQEPVRPSQGSGKAEAMQGVAFLHRESRPNTRPNRTQRPQR